MIYVSFYLFCAYRNTGNRDRVRGPGCVDCWRRSLDFSTPADNCNGCKQSETRTQIHHLVLLLFDQH